MFSLLSLVPWYYRALAIALLVLAVFGYGWLKGAQHGEAKLDAIQAQALKEGARIVVARGEVTTQVITKFLPAIERQHVVTETIFKEVPIYVSPADPDLPGGFRVLHDAAAAGRVPDPADRVHAAAVPAQDAAATVTENYGFCRENFLRLQGLQEWVAQQQKVK